MKLEFREIEAVFSTRYGIATDHGKAFRGRLQHLQRLGFPEGVNTGKGKKAEYGWKQFIQLSLALDLIDLGIAPDAATTMIKSHWAEIEMVASSLSEMLGGEAALSKAITEEKCPLRESTFVLLDYAAISSMSNNGLVQAPRLYLISGDAFLEMINERDRFLASFVAIDLTVRLLFSMNTLSTQTEQPPRAIAQDMAEWGARNGEC